MLVCSRCGSQSIVPEQEYVVGVGWVSYPKCFKCGSVKVEEREGTLKQEPQQTQVAASSPMTVLKKEETMAGHKPCKSGCGKSGQFFGYCTACFTARYGITYAEYKKNKMAWSEDPADVAIKMKAKEIEPETEPKEEPRVRLKPEAIERAVAEGRITPEKGAQLRNESHNKAVEEFAYPVTPPAPEKSEPTKHCPNLALYIPDELYAKIVQLAEQEYRPVAWQVQYLLHKGMEAVGA